MINLDDWNDYSQSAKVVRCIERNVRNGNHPRLLVVGVNNVMKKNGFVQEDADYAMELIGEKATNFSCN